MTLHDAVGRLFLGGRLKRGYASYMYVIAGASDPVQYNLFVWCLYYTCTIYTFHSVKSLSFCYDFTNA